MKPLLFVRDLTQEEHQALEKALRSTDAFTLRRAQILLQSAKRRPAAEIADHLGCTSQTVRNAIHAFNDQALAALTPNSSKPKTIKTAFDAEGRDRLLEIAHTSPRDFSRARAVWSLETLAEVSFEEGLTQEQVSHETIRRAIDRLGSSWQRAKHWITSPDAQYELKKNSETA